ncbi:GDSL esterase/lipase At4g01130 [Phragmites australis]|uniref:GDSL esterase/lipase At4g01130 n=1 Tax=Phragmites australis TaxID=29695 RepID=UPI002D7706EA|nr:GDSL esterase/lipase At4g01130 [Phragmites australis]
MSRPFPYHITKVSSHVNSLSTMKIIRLLLLVCCLCPAARAGSCKFPAVFNFGDSNSDTGGFWAAFPAQQAPFGMTYFHRPAGRASDGRLVIDFVVQALGLPLLSPYLQSIGSDYRHGANFATLASTALLPKTSVFVTGTSPFSLGIQLNQMKEFRNRVISSNGNNGQLPPLDVFGNALYTIDIGQNDFTSNLGSLGVETVKQSLPSVVNQISWTIQDLYNIGARNFMVFNMAPIGCYLAFLTELPHSSNDLDEFGCMKTYNSGVVYFNELLNSSLAEVRKKLQDASIVYVDKHSVTLDLFQHPNAHGLKYGNKACCGYGGGAYNFNQDVYCGNSKVVNNQTVSATACGDPQNYLSWDGIHATEAANKIIASAVISGSYSYPAFNLSKLCSP